MKYNNLEYISKKKKKALKLKVHFYCDIKNSIYVKHLWANNVKLKSILQTLPLTFVHQVLNQDQPDLSNSRENCLGSTRFF